MTDKKISELDTASDFVSGDYFVLYQSATTKKLNANVLIGKINTILATEKAKKTGFLPIADVVSTYDKTLRTITISGTYQAYYDDVLVAALIDGWVSPAHPVPNKTYYLGYDGTNFEWSEVPCGFRSLQIAIVPQQDTTAIDSITADLAMTTLTADLAVITSGYVSLDCTAGDRTFYVDPNAKKVKIKRIDATDNVCTIGSSGDALTFDGLTEFILDVYRAVELRISGSEVSLW